MAPTTQATADDLDQFVQSYRSSGASKAATAPDEDDLDQFVKSYRSSGASKGTTAPDEDDLDSFVKSYQAQPSQSSAQWSSYAKPGPYTTALPPKQEQQFQSWVKQNKIPSETASEKPDPTFSAPDNNYDMRGYWKAQVAGDKSAHTSIDPLDGLPHFPDTWKTPYHSTFSNESQYALPSAGHWDGENFVPPAPPAQQSTPQGPSLRPGAPPSLFQRAKSTVANSAIGHAISETMPKVSNALGIEPTETVYNPQEAQHADEIIAPGAAFDKPGGAKGVAEFAGSLTTPGNALLAAGSGGIGELSSVLGTGAREVVPKLISLGFSAQMAGQAVQRLPDLKKAISEKRYDDAEQIATESGLSVLFSALAFKHAGTEGAPDMGATLDRSQAVAPETVVNGQTAADYLKSLTDRTAAAVAKTGRIDDQGVPRTAPGSLPRTMFPVQPSEPAAGTNAPIVGAGEKLAPETPETLKAQTDALAAGTNPVVYFPKGTDALPAPPDNANVTVVNGTKPGAGTYYHDDSVTPQQIRAAVTDGTYGKLLGHVQTKEEASGPEAVPVAITARDDNGNELKSSLVDASQPDMVRAQAQTLAKQFPGSTIDAEPTEKVIAARQAVPRQTSVQGGIQEEPPELTPDNDLDTHVLAYRTASIEARTKNAQPILLSEITSLHDLMDGIEARNAQRIAEAVRTSAPENELVTAVPSLPKVGSRITVTAGPLEGRDMEVTRAGETGVYVSGGDGPTKFVKYGEFAPRESAAERTASEEIEGSSRERTRGLALGVEEKAVQEKLARNFGDLPKYNTVSMKDQAAKAVTLISDDYELARDIAMGRERPPTGILPESVFVAVEDKALRDNDVNTLRDLATQSSLVSEATTMGQRIRTLGERDDASPTEAIKGVQAAREKVAQAKLPNGETLEAAKGRIAREIKAEIQKATPRKEDWASFVQALQC